MGRPRKLDDGLPECVYFRNGSYFFVKRGAWLNLGKDRAEAIRKVEAGEVRNSERDAIRKCILSLVARSRMNAKSRGISFDLCKADILDLMKAANWRCMVTNSPFSLEKHGTYRPFAPSLDRTDSSRGYSRENCRLVCVAANFAMNTWGDKVLRRLISHFKSKRSFGRPLDSDENSVTVQ